MNKLAYISNKVTLYSLSTSAEKCRCRGHCRRQRPLLRKV